MAATSQRTWLLEKVFDTQYLGKVKKLIPGLNAAFVDVGYEKDAFLHYTDLSPYVRSIIKYTQLAMHDKEPNGFDFSKFQTEPEILKTGKINEVLNGKPNVLVQILKEPIAAKGPRLSCEISLPGRFVVVTPFNEIVAVSKKIHSGDERKRLHKIVEAIRPKNFGIIVRTAAEGKSTLWSAFLNNILAICGTAIPIKPIGPQNAVTLPASNVVAMSIRFLVFSRFTPRLLAYASPINKALRSLML